MILYAKFSKIFMRVFNDFSLCRDYFPLVKVWHFLNQFESYLPKMFCAKVGWNWQWFGGRRFLKVVSVFSLNVYHLSLKKGAGLYINKLANLLHPRMLYAKFCWNQPSNSGEDLLAYSIYFHCVLLFIWTI